MPFEPLQILSGAVLGFATTGGLRWWQYRRDLWLARVEGFCKAVEEAADQASDYWLKSKKAKKLKDNDAEERRKIRVAEVKLIGLQIKIDGLFVSIENRLLNKDQERIQSLLNDLTEALTGGDFEVMVRSRDEDRARLCQSCASEIVVLARTSSDRALNFAGTIRSIRERADERQRASMGL